MQSNNSHRQLSRLADLRAANDNVKRFFGRDITNLDRRVKKNTSIYEKVPIAKMETKVRSRSLYGKKQVHLTSQLAKDAIFEYKQQVLNFLVSLEKKEQNDCQNNVTEKMRQILIDWLVDVHDSFELKEQTLHLALSYLSDFAAIREISKEDYQLVGISCLWIASKYEQIYPPKTKNYVEVTADTYTLKDLKNMESNIIQALNFNLQRTTALQILQALVDTSESNEKATSLCKYAIEMSLFEGIGRKFEPSILVASAVHLAECVLKCKIDCKLVTKTTQSNVSECFKEMCILLQNNNKYDLSAVKRKFGRSRYHQIAKVKLSLNE